MMNQKQSSVGCKKFSEREDITKNDLVVGHLIIRDVFDDDGEFHYRKRTFDAECECGEKLIVTNWDIALKKITSCGCHKPTELEDIIINYLEDHDYPYILDFHTRERNGNPITFDILVPVANGKVIIYDQDISWARYDSLKSVRETLRKTELRNRHVKELTSSFGIDSLFITYNDLDRAKDMLDEFLGRNERD